MIYKRNKASGEMLFLSMRSYYILFDKNYNKSDQWGPARPDDGCKISSRASACIETLHYEILRGVSGYEDRYSVYDKTSAFFDNPDICGLPLLPHRDDDKPAVVWSNNHSLWFKDGKQHRDGKPSEICNNDEFFREAWHQNNELHRYDGPALIHISKKNQLKSIWWCVNGNKIPDEKIQEIIERHDLNPDWKLWTEAEKIMMRLAL